MDEDKISGADDERKILSTFSMFKKSTGAGYLTSGTKKTINHLWHGFTQPPIFQHFNLKCYIWSETDVSGYAIGKVLSQLILDNLG